MTVTYLWNLNVEIDSATVAWIPTIFLRSPVTIAALPPKRISWFDRNLQTLTSLSDMTFFYIYAACVRARTLATLMLWVMRAIANVHMDIFFAFSAAHTDNDSTNHITPPHANYPVYQVLINHRTNRQINTTEKTRHFIIYAAFAGAEGAAGVNCKTAVGAAGGLTCSFCSACKTLDTAITNGNATAPPGTMATMELMIDGLLRINSNSDSIGCGSATGDAGTEGEPGAAGVTGVDGTPLKIRCRIRPSKRAIGFSFSIAWIAAWPPGELSHSQTISSTQRMAR